METFYNDKIFNVYSQIKKNNIIPLLNNQGRRPEQVYFSWMRGFVISHYFQKSLAYIFNTTEDNISIIGADDFSKKENFKRSPTADLLIITNNTTLRIEMQSGFQDINDIKQHKVLEAKNIYNQSSEKTLVIHFDIFNGQVAFVPVYNIENTSLHWITRQQMEGQTVFNISQNNFIWKLTEQYPSLKEIEKILCL